MSEQLTQIQQLLNKKSSPEAQAAFKKFVPVK